MATNNAFSCLMSIIYFFNMVDMIINLTILTNKNNKILEYKRLLL